MTDVRLTNKQRAFIEHYLETWNATEAARRAGYEGNDVTLATVGYQNVRKLQIAEAIKQRLAEKAMGADEALSRLAVIARGNTGEYRVIDQDVKTNDVLRALELILKATGAFSDGVTINLPPFDPKEWKRKAKERLKEVEDLDDPYKSEGDADPE